MVFENSIKGFIILFNLEGFSNYYKWHHLWKYKKNQNIIKICTINIIKIGNHIMYNNNIVNIVYESYYDSVILLLSLETTIQQRLYSSLAQKAYISLHVV